jgi:hypothetical protein
MFKSRNTLENRRFHLTLCLLRFANFFATLLGVNPLLGEIVPWICSSSNQIKLNIMRRRAAARQEVFSLPVAYENKKLSLYLSTRLRNEDS